MLRALRIWTGDHVLRLGNRLQLVIAATAIVVILTDALTYQSFKTVGGGFFDTLIALRVRTPEPDPKVIIVDIDEGSLAEIGKTYGRWPWPNEVFADVLYALEKHQVRQVVFDILFSDRDVLRPQSDQRFNSAVADVGKRLPIYFPMVRLNPINDNKSQIPTGALPGARDVEGKGSKASTIAVILPQVPSALERGNLAFLNVNPDRDGLIRHYPVNFQHDGWTFDSYGVRIGREIIGNTTPAPETDFLLNWRGPPFSYHYISFKDLFNPKKKVLEKNVELQGATVIIGSTAPALQDLKATPMGSPFPGVEVLATAIDNTANQDYIKSAPAWFNAIAAVMFVVLLAYLFTRGFKPDQINLLFLIIQAVLILAAWAALSFFTYFLNFSVAVTYGTVFFVISKISALQLLPLSREALFRQIRARRPHSALVTALTVDSIPPANLRFFYERLIIKGQERGLMLAGALEPDEDAGAFGEAFHRTLVVVRLLSDREREGIEGDVLAAKTQALIVAELDRSYSKSRVNSINTSYIEIADFASREYDGLGPYLYSKGIQTLSETPST